MAGGPANISRAAREPSTTNQVLRASQNASAYDVTNQLFNALLPYFGQQAQMPMVYFTQTFGPGGERIRDAETGGAYPKGYQPSGYGDTGVVAYPNGSAMLGGYHQEPMNKQRGSDALIHELAHVFQNPGLISSPNRTFEMEGGAEGFTELARDQIARVLGLPSPSPWQYNKPYGPLGEQFIAQYGPDYTLHGQFQF